MNTPRENPHAGYNFVQDNGVEELRNDFEGTVVNFCVSGLDGLGGLSPAKYAQLAARGIIVSRDAEQVLIPDSMREFIEWIFQTYGEALLYTSTIKYYDNSQGTPKLGENGRGYGASLNYFQGTKILENDSFRQRIRTFEFFNRKSRTLEWLRDNNFGDMIQEGSEFSHGIDALREKCKEIELTLQENTGKEDSGNVTYFIKSSVGASGAGTWKIDSVQGLQNMFSEIEENGYEFVDDRLGENGEILQGLYYDESSGDWKNARKTENTFIIQEKYSPRKSESGETQLGEYSANFFLSEAGSFLVTESENIVDVNGEHKGNKKTQLPSWVQKKLDPVIQEMHEQGFRGNIGFDFFIDFIDQRIIILECNPRNTGATNPEILSDVMEETQDWVYATVPGKYADIGDGNNIPVTPHIETNGKLAGPQVVTF